MKFVKYLLLIICCLGIMVGAIVYGFSSFFSSFFASEDMDESLVPDASSQYYDYAGNIVYTTQSEERRIPVELEQIPNHTRLAFIAIEDNRFYEHSGIDYRGTLRALISNLSGNEVQGGSTITQQLAKNAFLTQERTLRRKIKEAFIARELENQYSKDEILSMYLNRIYFGEGAYGVESAALYYFGKHASELDLAESAALAAIPKSPNFYDPLENPKDNKERQELVLDQMQKYGFITEAACDEAKAEKLQFNEASRKRESTPRSYFFDMVTQKVIDIVGADALYKGGLRIYTTLDMDMQLAAESTLEYLPEYYTDSEQRIQPQMALVAVDPKTGYIKALIGGRGNDKFNRATIAVRQPGSSFKPFVYLTAMQNGYTPASVIEDKEEEFTNGWKPQNSNKKWNGKVSLRTALTRSINVPTIKLANMIGVGKIVANAEKMGITTLVDRGKFSDLNLAMAIGGLSKGVNPLEMASAYSVLATNGIYARPLFLLKIQDRNGKTIYQAESTLKRVIDADSSYLTTHMLQDVFTHGTAYGMGIGRPAAGKTGTTDDFKDAWFVGYTPNLTCAVWIGDDNNQQMDHMYGSNEPLTVWHNFMVKATAKLPAESFINPGVKVPPEPLIIQDNKDKKDQDKEKKVDNNSSITVVKDKAKKADAGASEVQAVRRSLKDRIHEINGGQNSNLNTANSKASNSKNAEEKISEKKSSSKKSSKLKESDAKASTAKTTIISTKPTKNK